MLSGVTILTSVLLMVLYAFYLVGLRQLLTSFVAFQSVLNLSTFPTSVQVPENKKSKKHSLLVKDPGVFFNLFMRNPFCQWRISIEVLSVLVIYRLLEDLTSHLMKRETWQLLSHFETGQIESVKSNFTHICIIRWNTLSRSGSAYFSIFETKTLRKPSESKTHHLRLYYQTNQELILVACQLIPSLTCEQLWQKVWFLNHS